MAYSGSSAPLNLHTRGALVSEYSYGPNYRTPAVTVEIFRLYCTSRVASNVPQRVRHGWPSPLGDLVARIWDRRS